jgi:hypothetical protein
MLMFDCSKLLKGKDILWLPSSHSQLMQQNHSDSNPKTGILFALCNPLLDISVTANQELLDRFKKLFLFVVSFHN